MSEAYIANLKAVIRALEENNKARYAEIAALHERIRAMRARLTKMQQSIERKNKERANDQHQAET
jgi:Skp family chaperone for outer membrane proteins